MHALMAKKVNDKRSGEMKEKAKTKKRDGRTLPRGRGDVKAEAKFAPVVVFPLPAHLFTFCFHLKRLACDPSRTC